MTATDRPKRKKTGGRKPGSPNKATQEFRQTVQDLLDANAANVQRWLKSVADGDEKNKLKPDPGRALDLMSKLAEYAAPKLSRTELTGPGGKELAAPQFIVQPVAPPPREE